jgi:hypothetical protein
MAYSKAKLKCSGDGTSPCFRPIWRGKLSDKCLPVIPIKFLLHAASKRIFPFRTVIILHTFNTKYKKKIY